MEVGMSTGAGKKPLPLANILAKWASSLTPEAIPKRVREFAVSQLASQIAAARATMTIPIGQKIIRAFGHPLQSDPKASAYVLAALTMAIDYDDTMYAGHVSHSSVAVPLAYARSSYLDGPTLLTAIVTANESAARITAAATLGKFRGQTAAHTHLAASVAARMYLEKADPTKWASAWGIAFSAPPWTLDHPFFAGESKALTASTQIRAGLDACDAALAGMVGAADVFEHPDGFLSKYADIPLPGIITNGLGRLWHTETLSIKIYPGCAYIDSAIDCAIAIYRRELEHGHAIDPDTVDEVIVEASAFTTGMDAKSSPYIDGPNTPISAIGFSVGYNVAVALARGTLKASDLTPEHIGETSIWELARKVRVVHDMSLTLEALQATAPIGEALRHAGNSATNWLLGMAGNRLNYSNESAGRSAGAVDSISKAEQRSRRLSGNKDETPQPASPWGKPSTSFRNATKSIGARVTVRFNDGHTEEEYRKSAIGAIGPETRSSHRELAMQKLADSGISDKDATNLFDVESLSSKELSKLLVKLLGIPK